MRHRTPLNAALAAVLTLAAAARADQVTEQLDAARKAYDAGDLRTAADTLNFAVAAIKERQTADLLKLLPEPLAGWQADPGQSQSGGLAGMITGINLTRRYFRADGAEVNVTVTADSPLLPMLTMFLSSPFMMQADPGSKPYTFKGQRGITKHAPDSDEYEVSLMIGNRLLIQAKGSGLQDAAAVQQYIEAMDVEAIQKGFGG
ncbi:hypothetical protein [uncultured Thiodictyon sp.]|uniref:hypothetical protein n=1 Tax=uncultured Thiodictyon sp. TaxID=1846217 RepID=UPI0025F94F29|nr:hypothetical protein [uncultured Thiodictyon sp.]